MWWPDPDYVHAINDACVEQDPVDRKYGGGIIVKGVVERIVADAAPAGLASDENLVRAVAELLRNLAVGHPFKGCNKRTAFIVAAATLRANGWILEAAEGEVSEFLRELTAQRGSAAEVEKWLRPRLRKE